MMAFIRELISDRWIKVRMGGSTSQKTQIDPQGGVISMTLFLVAINGILGELEKGVDRSFFANYIYNNKKQNSGS